MSREKARQALERLLALEAKIRAQRREIENLRASLMHEGYKGHGGYYHRNGRAPVGRACLRCGGEFVPGQHYVEYLDDDDHVVATYHSQCTGTHHG